jgi:hypothetical protein
MLNTTGSFYPSFTADPKKYSPDLKKCIEETVESILTNETTSDHPGMLLGKIQSGKTRTFIGAIALAFDNTFDIAIVLTKNSRPLVEQTYKRLRFELQHFISEGDLEIYDIMQCPEEFTPFELESKLIFVAKKETNNLVRLNELFTSKCPAMAGKHILIIDDEADSASIGYSRKAGLIEANKIAKQISDFRTALPNSAFLQVTATPYSLYLQPTDVVVGNVATFKPIRPAFTKPVPTGVGYIGGDTYFGEESRKEENTLQSLIHHMVDPREFDRLKSRDGRSYKPDELLTTDLYKSIRHAIVSFLVGATIQRMNGKAKGLNAKKLRYSFLLHSETAKGSHTWQETLVAEIVEKIKAAAHGGVPVFNEIVEECYEDLKRSLTLDGQPIPILEDVIKELKESLLLGCVTISKVNSEDDVSALLDDNGQLKLRSPYCIFIGGQVIDRGVTLANLLVFYYGRRPQRSQQDTVLQHSRMYGYRRDDLAVTRFYTAPLIRHAMTQMEEFDSSLRNAILAGGDKAVQFIRRAQDGSVIPCSPNKILVSSTQTLRPHRRVLPIGFHSGHRTGKDGIGTKVEELDAEVKKLCDFNTEEPVMIPLQKALDLLGRIEPTLRFEDEDAPEFEWDAAKAVLCHLSNLHKDPAVRGKVLLWAADNRNSARKASASSHATYIETPDSDKTEGRIAREHAIDHPILFLLRQNGTHPDWRGTPFYWPVIRAQANTPTAIYSSETLD